MEFEAIVSGERFRFSSLNQNLFLVSGPRAEYLLYHNDRHWRCADEIEEQLLDELGQTINAHTQVSH